MLKILLYAYTQNQFSGRKIERMMWLAHHEVVSYHTLNRFRVTPHTAALLQECFIQFRSQLVQADLIDNQAIYIDGTKIEADANKFSFVWRKLIESYNEGLDQNSQALYEELVQAEILPRLKEEEDNEGEKL